MIIVNKLFFLVQSAFAHLCMLNPVQRGGFNVSDAGDNTCFQPNGPCGKKPSGAAVSAFYTGSVVNLLVQQNLNHYNPGYPGFIEISFATGNNPKETDFVVLKTIVDYWPHMQAQQTNITIPVTMPNFSCDPCVIRARYHPNKPTEPIFHQCSDVKLVDPPKLRFRLYGWVSRAWEDFSFLAEIKPTGHVHPTSVTGRLRMTNKLGQDEGHYIANGMSATIGKSIYYIGDTTASFQNNLPPSMLFSYSITNDRMIPVTTLQRNGGSWCSLIAGDSNNALFIVQQIQASKTDQTFYYQVQSLDTTGKLSGALGVTEPNDTYVNFLWGDYDPTNQFIYLLAGDENSVTDLNVVLYTIDIKRNVTRSVNVNHSTFTVTSMFVDRRSGAIYSLSPGLFSQDDGYFIVQIDPTSGFIKGLSDPFGQNKFSHNWAGSIYGGLANGNIFHHFWSPLDGSSSIVPVDITGQPSYWAGIDLGINSGFRVHSLTLVNDN